MISKILRKNTSVAQMAGFVLSNFIGLVIVLGGLQFFLDARSIWSDSDSIINTDYLVINKKVTSAGLMSAGNTRFTEEEIARLGEQPWVRSIGRFTSNDYRVMARVEQGGRGMSTYMFFEAIPDEFVDVPRSQWAYQPGSDEVPIIMSKDYLTLYNFGFASSAGLPQMSEGLMSSIPLTLELSSEDGSRRRTVHGRVAGFSNRLNTILVPEAFMEATNREFGSQAGAPGAPDAGQGATRLIIDVSRPGDTAISAYLSEHDWEQAGDKSAAGAAFLLRVVVGIVLAIGTVITILSLLILLLSISLIMERNRAKLHSLLMLGYPAGMVARPYASLAVAVPAIALVLSVGSAIALRAWYITPLEGLGATPAGVWEMILTGVALAGIVCGVNLLTIRRRVRGAFR